VKIIRYQLDDEIGFGILEDDNSIRKLTESPFEKIIKSEIVTEIDKVKILPPVIPSKIIGVGLNYVSHIEEMGMKQPDFPMLFMKPPTAVIGSSDPIIYPTIGNIVEYEAELAIVIGKPTRQIKESNALDHVLGYTCGNDVSERIIQKAEMSMGAILVSKGFDTFNPLGPVISTDIDPKNTQIKARINGKEKQNANTSDLLFGVSKLISYISEAILLLPGDVIMSGTPSGVGSIKAGDEIEIEIEGVGILQNNVIDEESRF
tara:strand:- start:6234 stop:7016 length:783 start_codon:yes stop_codon:yes gene_type:complete